MNSTSFTSIEPNNCVGSANNDKNFDSSSTAHLTLNAIGSGSSNAYRSPTRHSSNNSDSDIDVSPRVAVLGSFGRADGRDITNESSNNIGTSNHLHLHHHLSSPIPRASRLLTSGFSLSTRINLGPKHQRSLWARATNLEKVLICAIVVFAALSTVLFTSLISIIISQRQEIVELSNQTSSLLLATSQQQKQLQKADISKNQQEPISRHDKLDSKLQSGPRDYCLTPDCVKVAASVIEAIDLTVDPCDDFYVSPSTVLYPYCSQLALSLT